MRFPGRPAWLFPLLVLAAGAILRLWLIHAYPQIQGDSLVYGDIAANWLRHGIYGHSVGHDSGSITVDPTLVRLPGYPAFLAFCFAFFGVGRYYPVLYLQALIDLLSCLLIASFAASIANRRAGQIALLLAALCPFTAIYTAAPLTETLSIFCVALAFRACAALLQNPSRLWTALLVFFLSVSWSYAALLRPDGALLAVVLCPALVLYGRHQRGLTSAIRLATIAGLLAVLPFVAWTIRNQRTFHVFQPLAPRYANDPGEFAFPGFVQWIKSFTADFTTTSEIYWNGDSDKLNINLLPQRAFDSPAQYQQTRQLLDDYNLVTTVTPELDQRFAQLAQKRAHTHPLRYYVGLPLLRLADMWFRPRVEMLNISLRWWQYQRHPRETCVALYYGALNLAYLTAACLGALRRPRLTGAMLALIVLRSLLLATLEAPEPRYTLECFPLIIALGAVALAKPPSAPASSSPAQS